MASYRKRDNGLWEYRISYKDAMGKYKRKEKGGFKTKAEATLAAAQVEIELQNDTLGIDKEISLLNYFKRWADVYKRPNVSHVTYKAYQHTERKIEQLFGDRKLKDITATQYQEIINQYASTHAQDTVERFNIHVKACVKMSVHEGYIKRNFCEFVTIKATNKGRALETKFLEVEEYQKVIDTSFRKRQYQSYAAIYLIAKTGMRFSECLGVTVDDIDYKNATLSVDKTWDYKYNTGFMPTKNKSSIRTIPLDKETLEFIRELPETPSRRLFDKLSNNAVNKSLRAIVGREVRVHSLRHTYASFLISKGVDLISISQVLGHENLNITLEVYAHQLQEQKQRNDDKIRNIWGGIGAKP